jgi:Zn-dependent peptidase ImmA (M78 family)
VEYRKRATTPKKLLDKISADVLDQAERWAELENLWPNFPLPDFVIPDTLPKYLESLDEIENTANMLRDSWELGTNPIPDLIDALESRSILVITTNVDVDTKFDGLQANVANKPVIVVSSNWPGDRQRFTLAHELGHLLLHDRLTDKLDEEKACNRFAGALLLPGSSVCQHLGKKRRHLEPKELYLLKMEYGISMRACAFRALDLGIIDDNYHRRLSIEFAKRGWRKNEPGGNYPGETTLTFQQLVYRALGENVISESKAAELLGISLMRFHKERKLESLDATATHQ